MIKRVIPLSVQTGGIDIVTTTETSSLFTSLETAVKVRNSKDKTNNFNLLPICLAHHWVGQSIRDSRGVGPEAEGWVWLWDGVGGEVGLHPRHAPHVAHRVGHELGRHRGHLVVVPTHGVSEGVPTAHPHPHAHPPPPVVAQPEEVRHPGPLLLGLGGELPVPGLDAVLLHGERTFNLKQRSGSSLGFIFPILRCLIRN